MRMLSGLPRPSPLSTLTGMWRLSCALEMKFSKARRAQSHTGITGVPFEHLTFFLFIFFLQAQIIKHLFYKELPSY